MFKLDLKDRKILYELDKNSRQSNSEIAKKVRLNKNTVTYKIKRLEEENIIPSYYCVIDTSKLGYFSFRVYLNFFNTTPEKEKEIIDYLIENKLSSVVGKSETSYDLGFMVCVKNIYVFDEFWLEFKKKFRKYFWKERVHVFSKVWHFKRKYLTDEKKFEDFEFVGTNIIEKYDDTDMKILRLLVLNARMPLIEMASKLKMPPRTVAHRIKQLEKKKIILAYRINLNIEKIGYEYYKINMILDNYDEYDKFMMFAKNHQNIIYIDRTLSELDFEIDVEVKDKKELMKLTNEMKSKFNIRDVEVAYIQGYYKLRLLPEE